MASNQPYLQSIQQLQTLSTESIILNELFKILHKTFKCKGSIRSKIINIIIDSANIVGIFIFQYLVTNPDKIPNIFKFLIIKFIYKRFDVNLKKNTPESILFNKLQKDLNSKKDKLVTSEYNRLPLYLTTINDETSYIEYCPFIQQSFIDKYLEESLISFEEENKVVVNKNKEEIQTILKDVNRQRFTPDILYPSYNYTRLDKIIDRFFTVVKKTRMYKAQGILIDGEPGLGKSRSCDYLASLNKYHEIIYINMSLTEILKKEFKNIIKDIIQSKKNGSTIIYFDELDKYLDYNIDFMFKQYVEKLKTKGVGDKGKVDRGVDKEENIRIIETEINLEEESKTFHQEYKQNFLYELLEMIETSSYDGGIVFIFCSNNFDTIFEGVNQIHFNSLKSRFAPIKFERCDYREVVGYIKYFNNMMKDTDVYYDDDNLKRLINKLNKEISLTYRSIRHLHISAGYDIDLLINMINNYDQCNSPVILSPKLLGLSYFRRIEDKDKDEDYEVDYKDEKEEEYNNELERLTEESKKLDVDVSNTTIDNFLSYIRTGDYANVIALVDKGFNVNQHDTIHKTPLMYAVLKNNMIMTKKLLSVGADVNYYDYRTGSYVSSYCSSSDTSLFMMLLKNGLDITIIGNGGSTLLHKFYNNYDVLKSLLNRKKIDVDHQNSAGQTALHHAVINSRIKCARLLLEHRAHKKVGSCDVYRVCDNSEMKKLLDEFEDN
jgi:hypothetical protein